MYHRILNQFPKLIGISRSQFFNLHSRLLWAKNESDPQVILSTHQQLLVSLLWMRQNLTFKTLACFFGVSVGTLNTIVWKVVLLIFDALTPNIRLPSTTERTVHSVRLYRFYSVGAIDGTEQEVYASVNKRRAKGTYSGKKGYHTFMHLIVCGLDGTIWYISPTYLGNLNDLNMVDFPENWIPLHRGEEWLLGDGIFKGQQSKCILGYANFQHTSLASQFKRYRRVVENVIGMIKKWKICSQTWRQ